MAHVPPQTYFTHLLWQKMKRAVRRHMEYPSNLWFPELRITPAQREQANESRQSNPAHHSLVHIVLGSVSVADRGLRRSLWQVFTKKKKQQNNETAANQQITQMKNQFPDWMCGTIFFPFPQGPIIFQTTVPPFQKNIFTPQSNVRRWHADAFREKLPELCYRPVTPDWDSTAGLKSSELHHVKSELYGTKKDFTYN